MYVTFNHFFKSLTGRNESDSFYKKITAFWKDYDRVTMCDGYDHVVPKCNPFIMDIQTNYIPKKAIYLD